MKAVIQRVKHANVEVDGQAIAKIGHGLLVLLGVEKADVFNDAERMAHRLCGYRVFADSDGRMNLNLRDVDGKMLLVPQFTLVADTTKGLRPGFHLAAEPRLGEDLFEALVSQIRQSGQIVETGKFGADMKVELLNDGPVTFILDSRR
jgi:D-tyrosyl-tRNA(Tyr) deacylase